MKTAAYWILGLAIAFLVVRWAATPPTTPIPETQQAWLNQWDWSGAFHDRHILRVVQLAQMEKAGHLRSVMVRTDWGSRVQVYRLSAECGPGQRRYVVHSVTPREERQHRQGNIVARVSGDDGEHRFWNGMARGLCET
jgi:hypothetical protein